MKKQPRSCWPRTSMALHICKRFPDPMRKRVSKKLILPRNWQDIPCLFPWSKRITNRHCLDLEVKPRLPFEDNFFEAVTLLAVVEHLDPSLMAVLFKEVYRVLKPQGMVILTTPAAWSDGLLKFMARISLVSAEEIHEHAYAYTLPLLGWYFGQAGFEMTKTRFGYFELALNMWATAQK